MIRYQILGRSGLSSGLSPFFPPLLPLAPLGLQDCVQHMLEGERNLHPLFAFLCRILLT
jgi:hypothetical protein